jgi:hypothetical protein
MAHQRICDLCHKVIGKGTTFFGLRLEAKEDETVPVIPKMLVRIDSDYCAECTISGAAFEELITTYHTWASNEVAKESEKVREPEKRGPLD